MSKKEQYSKAIADVIKFDVSDPVVAFSNECDWEQKHDPICQNIFYEGCGTSKWTPSAYQN